MRCEWLELGGGGEKVCGKKAEYRVRNLTAGTTHYLCSAHRRDYVEGLEADVGTVDTLEITPLNGGRTVRVVVRGRARTEAALV
jgi:hypothetical protein